MGTQVALFADTIIATFLPAGALSALYYADRLNQLPIGVIGIMFLFWGSILMLRETRIATATVNAEMDFTWQLAREVAPKHVASKYARRGKNKGMKPAKLKDGTGISKTAESE